MKLITKFIIAITLTLFAHQSHGDDEAAAASATGSVTAPAKGAPKSAQANSQLRVLHIAVHKHGFDPADIKKLGLAGMKDLYTTHGSGNFRDHGDLLVKGHTLEDAKNYGEFLRDPANAGKSLEEALSAAKEAHADKYADPSLLINEAEILALSRYGSTYSKTAQFTSALTLAKSLLTDKAITSSLGSPISVSSLTGGYNLAFIRLLSAYGALGSNGEALATAVLGSDYSGYSNESAISSLLKSSSSDYLTYLSTLTGERTFKDEDISSSVLGIPLSQVNLVAGSTITLGQTGGTPSEVDVSSNLSKASSTSDRKVLVVGAAKDLKIAGDIRFKNSNNVEDHALVLGAADDVVIEASDIEYTGSNLGIGSGDTGKDSMYLVNTNIQTVSSNFCQILILSGL